MDHRKTSDEVYKLSKVVQSFKYNEVEFENDPDICTLVVLADSGQQY